MIKEGKGKREREKEMQTVADKKLEETFEYLENALKSLSEVVIDKSSGYEDYTDEFKNGLNELLIILMKTLRKQN